MTETELFRGYSLMIETDPMRIPSSGYYDVADLASTIVHQFQLYGRGLSPAEITKLTTRLVEWADDPAKPWTFQHWDMKATVRLTERFIGWTGTFPNMTAL